MDYGLLRFYGLWYPFFREPTWWTKKGMGYRLLELWVKRELTVFIFFQGFGKAAAEETGPNDARHIVWVSSKFLFSFVFN